MSYYEDFVEGGFACHECGQLLDRPSASHTVCPDCSGDTAKRKLSKPRSTPKPGKQWPSRRSPRP